MAKTLGNAGIVNNGSVVAEVTKFDITSTAAVVSDIAIGDTWSESTAGTKTWSGSVECFYKFSDAGQVAFDPGSSVTLTLTAITGTTFSGTAIIGAKSVSTTKDAYVTASFNFVGNGTLT